MSEQKLTDMQELFCREYLKDLNATQAAVRAGYSENSAQEQSSRLLSNAIVSDRVKELLDKRAKRIELTADKILNDIEETRIRCMQGVPVKDREGNETGEWKFEAHAALKASELQGKHLKLFTEVLKVEGKIEQDVTITRIDISERVKQIKGATE